MENNLKLSFNGTKYYVNFKKGTVTCTSNCHLKCGDENYLYIINNILMYTLKEDSVWGGFSVKATARLNEGEVFDEKVGMQVARAKMESAAYKRMNNILTRVQNEMNKVGTIVSNFNQKAVGVLEHNDGYLETF